MLTVAALAVSIAGRADCAVPAGAIVTLPVVICVNAAETAPTPCVEKAPPLRSSRATVCAEAGSYSSVPPSTEMLAVKPAREAKTCFAAPRLISVCASPSADDASSPLNVAPEPTPPVRIISVAFPASKTPSPFSPEMVSEETESPTAARAPDATLTTTPSSVFPLSKRTSPEVTPSSRSPKSTPEATTCPEPTTSSVPDPVIVVPAR